MIQRWSTAFGCLLSAALAASCVPMGGDTTGAGLCSGSMGTTQAARHVEAFLSATAAFNQAASGLNSDLIGACRAMARDLGMSAADFQGQDPNDVQALCATVNQRYQAELQAVRQQNVQVVVMARPPQCQVSVDAYAQCAARCDATVDPGSVQIQCEGGEIRGRCDAQCTGSCAASVNGSCSGTCEGACNGQCSARNADGSCAGQCNGTCNGQCVVRAQASCQAECRGGCSVEYREPYCTGQVRPPHVEAECQASCDARLEAQASCQPGQVDIGVTGLSDGALQARVERIRNATRTGLSSIYTIRLRAQRLAQSGAAVVRLAPNAARGARDLGVQAGTCATAAASAVAQSMVSVNVSVQVSVQVSGSVSASGG